jgi:Fe-S-cluster containining protein
MQTTADGTPAPANLHDATRVTFFDRLHTLFADMDRQYGRAAGHYGFACRGCEDNCCLTRFYHHTYLEYFYIHQGMDELDPPRRRTIRDRAAAVCRQTELADNQGLPVRQMCPLNSGGLCVLYDYRPMICRLHGIPHELQKPGQPVVRAPGCDVFDHQCADKPYFKFDRTRFYRDMALLENEFRLAAGLTGRIKLTIAEMIIRRAQSA